MNTQTIPVQTADSVHPVHSVRQTRLTVESTQTIANQPNHPKSDPSPGDADPTVSDADPTISDAHATACDADPTTIDFSKLTKSVRIVAEDLHHRLDTRSPLDHLTPEQQRALFDLTYQPYTIGDILEAIALPAPLGFNLKISEGALRRFRTRYEKACQTQRERLTKKRAAELKSQLLASNDPASAFQAIAQNLLHQRFLDVAADAAAEDMLVETLDPYIQTLNRLNAGRLAERKQTLAEKKQNPS
jgi:hypothetical protein